MLTIGEISQFFSPLPSSFLLFPSLAPFGNVPSTLANTLFQALSILQPTHFISSLSLWKGQRTGQMTSLNMVLFQHGFHLISHLWWFMMESSPGFRNILSFPIPTPKKKRNSAEGFPQWTACSSVQVQLRSVSMLKLYSGDLATLETVSGCHIPTMDKYGRQRYFGLKNSITKTAVETTHSKNLPSLLCHCLTMSNDWCRTSVVRD